MVTTYEVYASFARRYTWRTTQAIFRSAAELGLGDAKHRAGADHEAQREQIARDIVHLREHGLFTAGGSVDDHVAAVQRQRELQSLETILLFIYALDRDAHDLVEIDAASAALVESTLARHGCFLMTGAHVGPYWGIYSTFSARFQARKLGMVMKYASEAEWQASAAAMRASAIPELIRPDLVDPNRLREEALQRLADGRPIGMLSDATQPRKQRGQFRHTMFGLSWYAPSGPVRMAHDAQKPLLVVSLTHRADGGFRLRFQPLYEPAPDPLTDETIAAVLARKWGLFEAIIREDPVAWEGVGRLHKMRG